MKMKELTVVTEKRTQFVDITLELNKILANTNCLSGLMTVFVPHTTAGITINENADPDVRHDLDLKINKMIPEGDSGYRHDEGNSDSHLKSSLFSPSLSMIIEDGKLQLGVWQGVYFCEFDGPRTRTVYVKIISG